MLTYYNNYVPLVQLSNEQILSCLSLKAGLLGVFVRGKFQSFKVSLRAFFL